MKTCSRCHLEKPRNEFYRFMHARDGHQPHCKVCQNQMTTAYRKANPEKMREINRRAYQRNPEIYREAAKRWREANRERVRERVRRWYHANPEKVRARRQRWIELNPEKYEQLKRYDPKRRDYFREYMREYRARRKEASV